MTSDRLDGIKSILEALEVLPTYSYFSRLFYRLLTKLVQSCEHEELARLLYLLLRVELRRHAAVGEVVETGKLSVASLLQVSKRARQTVARLQQAAQKVSVQSVPQAMLKHLVVAECYYYMGQTGMVIASLKRALLIGCRHPVVYLALGYNLYCRAMSSYSKLGRTSSRGEEKARASFERDCRAAIDAFQAGIKGRPFDAQFHWWIGTVWEALDSREEARRAYLKARDVDPERFAAEANKRIRQLFFKVPDAMTEEESRRLSKLPRITEEELRNASKLLSEMDTFPDWFLDEGQDAL